MYNLPSEPQGVGKLLDSGFKLFFAGLKNVLALLAINIVANLVILGIFISSLVAMYSNGGDPSNMIGASAIVMVLALMVVNITTTAGYTAKMFGTSQNEQVGLGAAVSIGLKKVFPIVLWAIMYAVITMIGFVLLVIPGFIVMISPLLGMYLMVIENIGPIDALKRSHNLVWGNWWRTMLYVTIVYIIAFIVLLVIMIPIGVIVAMLAGDNPFIMASIDGINQLLSVLIMPFFIAMLIPYYNDLKLRKQGGDLAARIQAGSAN